MGRRSEPAEIKEAKGNPGHRPMGAVTTDELPVSDSDAPEILTDDAKEVWNQLVPDLRRVNLLRKTDEIVFAIFCEQVAKYWLSIRELEKVGHVYETDSNHGSMRRKDPWVDIGDSAYRNIMKAVDDFGLSPLARQRIFQMTAQIAQPALPGPLGEAAEKASAAVPEKPLHGFLN